MSSYPVEIRLVPAQTRFESWDRNDKPLTVQPESIVVKDGDAPISGLAQTLSTLYCIAFNAQNVRLWGSRPDAVTAWDEEPWTPRSAYDQLVNELSGTAASCITAYAYELSLGEVPVGFILSQQVTEAELANITGSALISRNIFRRTGNLPSLLLWEDVATRNLRSPDGQTIRGVGRSLYLAMASLSDQQGIASIARTSPGSFSPKILPAAGFAPFDNPQILDGSDPRRFWLARKTN